MENARFLIPRRASGPVLPFAVVRAAMIGGVGAVIRRTGLFIVSYAPLAAMFVALHWPSGWPAADLARLAAWACAVGATVLLVAVTPTLPRSTTKRVFVLIAVAAIVVVAAGVLHHWLRPLTLSPPKGRTSAATSAAGLAFCAAAVVILAWIIVNAHRGSAFTWVVRDPRDQGAVVAGYLATYLLPLLSPDAHGWRVAAAYLIYLLTLYVVFVRSDKLVLVNPTLYLFGYRIFDVMTDPPDSSGKVARRVLLLSKVALPPRADVKLVTLGEDSYIAKEVQPLELEAANS